MVIQLVVRYELATKNAPPARSTVLSIHQTLILYVSACHTGLPHSLQIVYRYKIIEYHIKLHTNVYRATYRCSYLHTHTCMHLYLHVFTNLHVSRFTLHAGGSYTADSVGLPPFHPSCPEKVNMPEHKMSFSTAVTFSGQQTSQFLDLFAQCL